MPHSLIIVTIGECSLSVRAVCLWEFFLRLLSLGDQFAIVITRVRAHIDDHQKFSAYVFIVFSPSALEWPANTRPADKTLECFFVCVTDSRDEAQCVVHECY